MRFGGPDLHKDAAAEDIDAWLRMSNQHQTLAENMYDPALVSLQDALEKVGAVTRIVDKSSDDALLAGIRTAVAKGSRPLLVDVGTRFGGKGSKDLVRACREAGAYVVLYSTEAGDALRVSEYATMLGAHEVWEYAMYNIDGYADEFKSKIPVRYLPPGYSPQLDVQVDLKSKKRRLRNVGFLGSIGARPPSTIHAYDATLGRGRIVPSEAVWTNETLRQYLNQFPLQLNMHKHQTCCPHDPAEVIAMEAFRMAPLLANGACVVSTPVPEKDRSLWEGIVHFAEVNETKLALRRIGKKVLDCQLQAGQLYKERFDPERLLRASGFLDSWRPRRPKI